MKWRKREAERPREKGERVQCLGKDIQNIKCGLLSDILWKSFSLFPTLLSIKHQFLILLSYVERSGGCVGGHSGNWRWQKEISRVWVPILTDVNCWWRPHNMLRKEFHATFGLTLMLFRKPCVSGSRKGDFHSVSSYSELQVDIWISGRRCFIIINLWMAITYECLLLAKCGKCFLCIHSSKTQNKWLFLPI